MDVMDIESAPGTAAMSTSQPPTPVAPPKNALARFAESDTESENDEAPAQIPRGKLLARLQPQMAANSSSSESEDEDDGDAYERMKELLMSGPSKAETRKEAKKTPKPTEVSSSEDEDMPVRTSNTRRLLSRREHSTPRASPSPSAHSRASSPGLFMTPDTSPVAKRTTRTSPAVEDDDVIVNSQNSSGLNERINRIRAERLAEQEKKRHSKVRPKKPQRAAQEGSDSDSDGENGRRLTQLSRPTRRAGKKALEDIAREQQRISRNMQLTHQAKTKKKYTVKDLFSKFGIAQVDSELVPTPQLPTPDASSALASSDAEATRQQETPATSPPAEEDDTNKPENLSGALSLPQETTTADVTRKSASPNPPRLDKGKGRAADSLHIPLNPWVEKTKAAMQSDRQAMKTPSPSVEMVELSDSDDDLQIANQKSRFPVFDRLPQHKDREAPSLLALRHLAHLTSPKRKMIKGRAVVNMTEYSNSLGLKARQQAQQERQEKIEELKRRGIHIETEEEREKHQLEVEDMVAQFEKARQEDQELAKLERKEAKANGEKRDDLPSSDESEDEDYTGSGDDEAANLEEVDDEAELELSGSEEEEGDEADDEEDLDEEESEQPDGLLDDAAEESGEEELEESMPVAQLDNDEDVEDDAPQMPTRKRTVNRPRNVVLDDEDEENEEEASQSMPSQLAPFPSQTQEDNGMAAFGFNSIGGTMGLTQMFNSTMANMDESQNAHPLDKVPEQDSMDIFRSLPDTQPGGMFDDTPDLLIPNSQIPMPQQDITPINLDISQLVSPEFPQSQLSETFEPTQDAGFELPRSPAGIVMEPSTMDTVMIQIPESPVMKKKGKLHQRKQVNTTELSDVEGDVAALQSDFAESGGEGAAAGNAFAVLKKAAKKQRVADNFNKKTSWARDVIQEQADESEDEYAGIGGVSDDDSDENDEELAEMIDSGEVKQDERKIAAYFAEKDKADDEKNINQLYKDLMNGGLRKRRGGDAFDMSDPEDEAEQRRRKKRLEFQQMTKALVSDERIGQIAQNPKKAAFFQTLADHMDDPDYEFLNAAEEDTNMDPSPSQSDESKEGEENTDITIVDSQAASPPNPLKRKSIDSQEKENHPPANKRRTAAEDSMSRKPITIADVQHSVSELLDDPRVMVPDSQYSDSDSELEIEPPLPQSQKQIINRLGMSRSSSSSESMPGGALAFHAPTMGSNQPGFKVPALIRRATSNLSSVSTSTSGTTTPVEGSGVRRGGTGRSNIHAQAREAERRAALEKVEKKRKETLKKKVGMARGKRSILGCLDGGFE